MAQITQDASSQGIKLSLNGTVLDGLQEIPDLGGTTESIDVTCLADDGFRYIDGIKNYGDSLDFTFGWIKEVFDSLVEGGTDGAWVITFRDGTTCSFTGSHSVKVNGVGVNAHVQYTLSVKPNSAMVWGTATA